MAELFMVTTIDNPYDYFTEFDQWQHFDVTNDYYTCSLVARIAKLGNDLSEEEERLAINHAVDEIIKENITGKYKRIKAREGGPL